MAEEIDIHKIDVEGYDFENCKTRKNKNGPYNKIDVVAAIIRGRTLYAEIAVLLGRSRTKVRDFILGNPDIKEIYDDVREGLVDAVEGNIFDAAIVDKDLPTGRFILSTIGKDRGYTVRPKDEDSDKNKSPSLNITISGPDGSTSKVIESD